MEDNTQEVMELNKEQQLWLEEIWKAEHQEWLLRIQEEDEPERPANK